MSKGLEAWERIKKGIDTNVWECGYWDDIELIEKELKALEIIKKKLPPLMRSALLDYCNKEEYDLLKEVLL